MKLEARIVAAGILANERRRPVEIDNENLYVSVVSGITQPSSSAYMPFDDAATSRFQVFEKPASGISNESVGDSQSVGTKGSLHFPTYALRDKENTDKTIVFQVDEPQCPPFPKPQQEIPSQNQLQADIVGVKYGFSLNGTLESSEPWAMRRPNKPPLVAIIDANSHSALRHAGPMHSRALRQIDDRWHD